MSVFKIIDLSFFDFYFRRTRLPIINLQMNLFKESRDFGLPTENELNDFETQNGTKLPQDYRDFLLKFNGGKPNQKTSFNTSTKVTYFLGMHNGDYYASLYKHIEMYKSRLPFGTFPVATDPFGNLFIMSLHPESNGHIYFWDHEEEPEYQDGHYTANCFFVANSFSEFVESLK